MSRFLNKIVDKFCFNKIQYVHIEISFVVNYCGGKSVYFSTCCYHMLLVKVITGGNRDADEGNTSLIKITENESYHVLLQLAEILRYGKYV